MKCWIKGNDLQVYQISDIIDSLQITGNTIMQDPKDPIQVMFYLNDSKIMVMVPLGLDGAYYPKRIIILPVEFNGNEEHLIMHEDDLLIVDYTDSLVTVMTKDVYNNTPYCGDIDGE